MAKLSDLQNIGKVLEARLVEAGVDTPETLRELGSREALVRLRKADPGACVRELYALEGAIRGVKDTALPVSPLGANTGTASELAVKSGAKIVIDYTLRITEDTLFPSSYLKTSPDWYGDLFYFKDVEHPIGAEDIVLTPTQELSLIHI